MDLKGRILIPRRTQADDWRGTTAFPQAFLPTLAALIFAFLKIISLYDSASAADHLSRLDPSFIALFDQSTAADAPSGLQIKGNDGAIVPGEKEKVIQTRAIFDEGRGWMTKAGADETIKRIKKAGFNVYIPCVWHGQGTRYPSPVAPPELNIDFSEGDPLKYLIDIAHKNGIEVHPWFTVALRQRDFLKTYYDQGTPKDAFNLYDPAFREFILTLILEVVERYSVDGINLDFIRTMGICKSSFCQDQYQKKYKRTLFGDLNVINLNNRFNDYVQDWVDNAVEEVVKGAKERSKKIRPGTIISVDGHPILKSEGQSTQGRQEVKWAKKGYVDIIFSMDYKESPDLLWHEKIVQELGGENKKLIILLANYTRDGKRTIKPRTPDALRELMKRCLGQNPHGIGVYIYSQLTDEQVDILGSFFNPKSVPHYRQTSAAR